jgi:hypothetical protein
MCDFDKCHHLSKRNVVFKSFVCQLGFFGTQKNTFYLRTRQINFSTTQKVSLLTLEPTPEVEFLSQG